MCIRDRFRAASGAQNRDEYREEAYSQGNGRTVKRVRMPGWLIAILVIMVFVVVISVVGSLMWAILPYLIPVVLVVYIIRLFQKK